MAAAATLSLSLGLVGHGLPVAHADERDDAQSQLNSANQKEAQLRSSLEGVDAKLGQAYLDAQTPIPSWLRLKLSWLKPSRSKPRPCKPSSR